MPRIPVVARVTSGILGSKEVGVVRVVKSRSHLGSLQGWTHDVERGANQVFSLGDGGHFRQWRNPNLLIRPDRKSVV